MLPQLGNYAFPEGRCEIKRSDEPEFNDVGQVLSNKIRLDVSSALYATDAATMDTYVRRLLTAFGEQPSHPDRDFVVYLPGGRVKSQLSLYAAGSMSGVKVVQPPMLEAGQKGAYCTWLPFTFALEAEYPGANSGGLYREWTESLKFDAMDRLDWLTCLHGPHQQQQIREFPFFIVTQSWRAVGYLGYPAPPQPIWPQWWINVDVQPDLDHPRTRRNGYTDFPASITYRFKSPTRLIGYPTPWPLAPSAGSAAAETPTIPTNTRTTIKRTK